MQNCLSAKWIVPMDGSPIKNGRLTFKEELISGIESNDYESQNNDEVNKSSRLIIVPGFINLHCHLDYSNVSFSRNPLLDWIENLVKTTREWTEKDFEDSALSGAQKALSEGTTFLIDSSYSGQSAIQMAKIGLKGIVGLEVFGVDKEMKDKAFNHWLSRYQKLEEKLNQIKGNKVSLTISPHAPYTVSPDLFKICNEWAISNKKLLLTHMAESKEENNWFLKGEKRLDHYLMNVLPPSNKKSKEQIVEEIDWNNCGKTSFESLFKKGLINENTILAHCVHIQQNEMKELRSSKAKVAHCPRSNNNLSVGSLNLIPYITNQIPLGLGSDSLAGTQTLSMLDEARYMANSQPEKIPGCKNKARLALGLITIEAAKVANMADSIGSLSKGKKADFVILKSNSNLDQFDSNSIYSHLLSENCQVESVYVDGNCLFDNSKFETSRN